jgi:hypothetical protein
VGEKRCIVVELNPADDAVILQVLRDFCFVNPKMLGELGLESAFGIASAAAAARSRLSCASAAAREVSQPDTLGLAGFVVVGSVLIVILKQENARPGGSFVGLLEFVQRAR